MFKFNIMKKLILICLQLFFYLALKAQNGTINNNLIEVTTGLNHPGLVHEGLNGTHKLGTLFRNNDAIVQTYTNSQLSFTGGSVAEHLILDTNGNVIIPEFTVFYGGVPIKQKKLTGLMDAYDINNGPATNDGSPYINLVPHGLDASKIISIRILINAQGAGFQYYHEEHTYMPGVRAAVNFDATNVRLTNYINQCQYILGSPVEILITYKK